VKPIAPSTDCKALADELESFTKDERTVILSPAYVRMVAAALRDGPESEAVKLLRRCHDAGDLVTPLDETLREDVAAFLGCSRATHSEGEKT
jgi:hypothetical protein